MSDLSASKLQELVKDNPFPIETTDGKVKEKKSFGLQAVKHIYYKSEYEDVTTKRRQIAQINRDFASNRNDINEFKKLLDAELDPKGDESYMNIDWSNQHPGKKFVDIVVGDMMNQDHKIQFNAIDSHSKANLRKDRDEFYGKIVRQRDIAAMEEASGLVLEDRGDFQPASKEEVDIYMELEYKQGVEIGMESIVDFELTNNAWDKKLKKRVIRDFVENNFGGVRPYFDRNNEIKLRYVDAPLGYGSSATDEPDFEDVDYEYERLLMSIRDLKKRDVKGEVTDKQWFKIAKDYAGKNGNAGWRFGDSYSDTNNYDGLKYSFSDYRVPVVDFVFYTVDKLTWADSQDKFGGRHMTRKPNDYKKPERTTKDIELIQKEIEMSYEGIWVINSDILVGYERSKNILRPQEGNGKSISPKLLKRYIVFQPNMRGGTSKSFVGTIIPNLKTIQLLVLRKRHIIAEMTPVGASYDVSGLQDVISALKETDYKKIIKLYKQKGILFHSRTDVNGDPVNGKPIEEMTNPFAPQLIAIDNAILNEIEHIRSNSGINDARDGSSPDKDALVGIEKMRLLASNNTTRETYKGFLDGVFAQIGVVMARMIQYKVEYGGGIKLYENIIGELGVKAVEFAKDITMAQLGIKIEALPTDDQIAGLLDILKISLQAGEIRPEDVFEIKRTMNIKKGERLLIYRRKKYAEEKMQEFAQKEQITSQREQAAAMAAAESEKLKQQARAEAEIAILTTEYALKAKLVTHTVDQEMKVIDRKDGYWKERLLEKQMEESNKAADDGIDKPKIFQNPESAIQRAASVTP